MDFILNPTRFIIFIMLISDTYGLSRILILMFIFITLTLLTIVFCYTHVILTIRNIKEDLSMANSQRNPARRRTDIERKTLRKVLTYILVFLIQYIPLMISDIFDFLKVQYTMFF